MIRRRALLIGIAASAVLPAVTTTRALAAPVPTAALPVRFTPVGVL